MINEEKVILMTHASLYENGEGRSPTTTDMTISASDFCSAGSGERSVLLPCWHYGSSAKWNT